MDETYRRLRYVRYADDFLIGVIGSKAECVKIKSDITKYMEENLKLELSQEKTLITNAQKPAKFLGFDVSVRKSDAIKRDKNNVPARYYNGKIVLKVAIETVRNKLEEYSAIRYKVEWRHITLKSEGSTTTTALPTTWHTRSQSLDTSWSTVCTIPLQEKPIAL